MADKPAADSNRPDERQAADPPGSVDKSAASDQNPYNQQHMHRDPITGEPGSHPLGAALGAAGAAAAGAAIGSLGGPIGALAGVIIGGLAGGLAGKELAESIDPTDPQAEHEYWSRHYRGQPYVGPEDAYHVFSPAYQHGWEAHERHAGKSFEEIEPELREKWEAHELKPSLEWERARDAVYDAWQRAAEQKRRREEARGPDERSSS